MSYWWWQEFGSPNRVFPYNALPHSYWAHSTFLLFLLLLCISNGLSSYVERHSPWSSINAQALHPSRNLYEPDSLHYTTTTQEKQMKIGQDDRASKWQWQTERRRTDSSRVWMTKVNNELLNTPESGCQRRSRGPALMRRCMWPAHNHKQMAKQMAKQMVYYWLCILICILEYARMLRLSSQTLTETLVARGTRLLLHWKGTWLRAPMGGKKRTERLK